MDYRESMKAGDKILLQKQGEQQWKPIEFSIVEETSRGASVLCYRATKDGKRIGILKEYYPENHMYLQRQADHHLSNVKEFSNQQILEKSAQDYMKPYEEIWHMSSYEVQRDLALFLPKVEIYRGVSTNGHSIGTYYIWMENELIPFNQLCKTFALTTPDKAEETVVTLLQIICSLLEGLTILHREGFVHRDIKPSNFGVFMRNGRVLSDTVTVFDMDTMCRIDETNQQWVGSYGYLDPESYFGATNQSDIYAVGVTLLKALAPAENYMASDYSKIPERVKTAKLLQSLPHSTVDLLVKIVERALASRKNRYQTCEEMLEDLRQVVEYVSKKTMIRTDRHVVKQRDRKLTKMLLYHLYEYPLYRYCPLREENLRVLVVGFDEAAQKFVDLCLQLGQTCRNQISVTILTDDYDAKENYLEKRPFLKEFFQINGISSGDKDIYGALNFLVTDFEDNELEHMRRHIQELNQEQSFHYCFISLQEDDLTSKMIALLEESMSQKLFISYLMRQENQQFESARVKPVKVDDATQSFKAELERMAFNVYLTFDKNHSVSINEKHKIFQQDYHYDSCLSNVVSIKYKLNSLGVDYDSKTVLDVARGLYHVFYYEELESIVERLAYLEHRRWVVEKVCQGWSATVQLEHLIDGSLKDSERKQHLCICPSRLDSSIVELNPKEWNELSGEALKQLDELDQLSIVLHQYYQSKAAKIRQENLVTGVEIQEMQAICDRYPIILQAFKEWLHCVTDIWNGEARKVYDYNGLKAKLLQTVETVSADVNETFSQYIALFEQKFNVILFSLQYRDLKQVDRDFVKQLPYILTHDQSLTIVVPLGAGRDTQEFDYVGSAFALRPKTIIYCLWVQKATDLSRYRQIVETGVQFLSKKQMNTKIEIVLIQSSDKIIFNQEEIQSQFLSLMNVEGVQFVAPSQGKDWVLQLESLLDVYEASAAQLAIEKNDTMLSHWLQGAGLYHRFASFRFNVRKQRFEELNNCIELTYRLEQNSLTVEDAVLFSKAKSGKYKNPDFYRDYRNLWKKYCTNRLQWKNLCLVLEKYEQERYHLPYFRIKPKSKEKQTYRFYCPSYCREAIQKIVDFLKEYDIVEAGTCITAFTVDSCEVRIVDSLNYQNLYERLFGQLHKLMISELIHLSFNAFNQCVYIDSEDLVVKNVQLSEENLELLRYFGQLGYVHNIMINKEKNLVSFTYATVQFKELLVQAGKILEIYIYHQLKEYGGFDDVVSGLTVQFEDKGVENEFDIVATKGFQTVIVECKARKELQQEFYHKLASLSQQFGVHTKAILVADTQEEVAVSGNHIQRERGDLMNIDTIWRLEDIENIGAVMMEQLLKGED